jgi:hypothetical protein
VNHRPQLILTRREIAQDAQPGRQSSAAEHMQAGAGPAVLLVELGVVVLPDTRAQRSGDREEVSLAAVRGALVAITVRQDQGVAGEEHGQDAFGGRADWRDGRPRPADFLFSGARAADKAVNRPSGVSPGRCDRRWPVVLRDPAGIVYAAAAVVFAVIAVIAWRRRAHNLTLGAALTVVMVGACWWAVSFMVPRVATNETVAAIAMLATFPGPSPMSAAFMCLGLSIARPQWVPRRAVILALLVEPVLITLAGLTNPWHLLVYRGAGAARLTGPAGWTYGPLFWLDTWFTYLEMVIGLGAIAWAWWKASPAFRGQRLTLLLAALVPVVANAIYVAGGFGDITVPDPARPRGGGHGDVLRDLPAARVHVLSGGPGPDHRPDR